MYLTEVVVLKLPPQDTPKQITARCRSHTLREHLVGFLCANNRYGFESDESSDFQHESVRRLVTDLPEETVGACLMLMANESSVNKARLSMLAKKLKGESNGTIKHCQALELMARLFGYSGYHEAQRRLDRFGRLRNRRNRKNVSRLIFDASGAINDTKVGPPAVVPAALAQ